MSTKSKTVLIGDRSDAADLARIIDANLNRATEGLRVVEEWLRFSRNDRLLSNLCKELRHKVSTTLADQPVSTIPNGWRTSCRSTTTDVGTSNETATEYERTDVTAVLASNLKRVTESLRVLEEYSKLFNVTAAREFEALRYETYTLEKAVGHLQQSVRLNGAILYALVDLKYGDGSEFEARIKAMLAGGVDVIQLRDKLASDRDIVSAAQRIRGLTREHQRHFVVNDRPDIARIVAADGVHVGQDELSIAETRSVVGPELMIGVSTHSLAQAREAALGGADYLGFGPVFPSCTKLFSNFVGVEQTAEVVSETTLPVFAIGGITHENIEELVSAGVERVAVCGALWHNDDPEAAARSLRKQLSAQRSSS